MSKRFSTIHQAERYLLRYSPVKQKGESYSLGRMIEVMHRLGNPQNDISAVHVAGTSGKTSTASYIRALLESCNKRTGLTTSPHISSITERIQIDGAPLDDDLFMSYLEEFLMIIEHWSDILPTYFELLTAFAFWVFKREQVDYMVIEVGLGGLLDATNVVDSPKKINVLTPIGLDHTEILGDTIAKIAAQKAGIVTPGSIVFSAPQEPEAMKVIVQTTEQKHAVLYVITTADDNDSTVPFFQQENFTLAKRVATYIARRDGLSMPSHKKIDALVAKTPPGRFEVYKFKNKTIILDGAHNPQKLAAFNRSLRHLYAGPFAWLVGFVDAPSHKVSAGVEQITTASDDYFVTEFTVGQDIKGRQSVPADVLAAVFTAHSSNVQVFNDPDIALERLLESKQRTVVVTGSLYLVARLRSVLAELTT